MVRFLYKKKLPAAVFILICMLTAACSSTGKQGNQPASTSMPSATAGQSSSTDKADWEKEYDQVLAAAKKEGELVINNRPSGNGDKFIKVFQDKFPEIKVKSNTLRPSDLSSRVTMEQKNGKFLWDVAMEAGSNAVMVMAPAGALANVNDYLIRDPQVIDDKNWYGGFKAGYDLFDNIGSYAVVGMSVKAPVVNRKFISKEELNSLDDLLNPKFKGKIVIDDPGSPAIGRMMLAAILHIKGEEFLRKLMKDQSPVYSRDKRQMTEWVADGKYPISFGEDDTIIADLKKAGLAAEVEALIPGGMPGILDVNEVTVFKNPPHPNAAKIFVHWALSKEGQEAYASIMETNSRRKDVKSGKPSDKPDFAKLENGGYDVVLKDKKGVALMDRVGQIYKEMMK